MLLEKIDMEHLTSLMNNENWWAWCIQDGKHWITNRHFVLILDIAEVDEETEGWELLTCLEEKFDKQTPLEGKQLVSHMGFINDTLGKSGKTIADSLKETILAKPSENLGVVTPLIYARKHFRNRYLKFPSFDLFVQDDYISVLYEAVKEPVYADGFDKPLFLCDGQFVILPVVEKENKKVVEELKAFESYLDLDVLIV